MSGAQAKAAVICGCVGVIAEVSNMNVISIASVCNRCHVRYLKRLSIVAVRQQLNQIDIHVHVNDKFPFVGENE